MAEQWESGDPDEIDAEFLERAGASWLTRKLLAVSFGMGMRRLAKELSEPGLGMSKRANALFDQVRRVDVAPSDSPGFRGFQMVIDGVLSLYFSQDGDHFVYDGFEVGYFEDGDVTVFDQP